MSENLIPDIQKNYLAVINGSVGTRMFRHLYAKNQDDKIVDVMVGGELSCAYFVSSILKIFDMIDRPHATVVTTIKTMETSGVWAKTDTSAVGDVTVWPENQDGHAHIGFVISDNRCVSNSWSLKQPVEHDMIMDDGRRPIAFWRYTRG
ncbi:MAG: hypothetical protein WBB94_03530 [Candidatus Saccharimonadaceae bacterium]